MGMKTELTKKENQMTEPIIETVAIPVYKQSYLQKKIDKINRKALKMGCDPLVLTFDNPHEYRTSYHPFTGAELLNPIVVEMIDATLTYTIPMIEGYELIATLDLYNGENGNTVLVSAVPEKTVPEEWVNATSIKCDHCGQNRFRTHSILLQHTESGEYKEVGSTCVKDFFGLDPKGFMFMASIKFHQIVGGIKDEDCCKGGRVWSYGLKTVLMVTAAVINKFGWTSKANAYNYNVPSTCDRVWENLEPYRGMPDADKVSADEADEALAEKVIEHFSNLNPNGNEYLTNLVKIAELGHVPSKYMGFACSMIIAYEKAMEIERKRETAKEEGKDSNFVGSLKERLKDIKVEVTFKRNIESDFGVSTLYAFKDVNGNIFKTFYSGYSFDLEVGDVLLITGTVKKHDEFRGVKQTMLNRVVVKEAPADETFSQAEFQVA